LRFAPKAQHSALAWGSALGFVNNTRPPALKARFIVPPKLFAPLKRAFSAFVIWSIGFLGRCLRFATANPSCGGLKLNSAVGAQSFGDRGVNLRLSRGLAIVECTHARAQKNFDGMSNEGL